MNTHRTTLIVALMGSYRPHGTIDDTVDAALEGARSRGAATHKIVLRERHLEFCTNCRECAACEGPDRGTCHLEDELEPILSRLDEADGIVLASPVNFGDVNALTRRLMERMLGYTHWPEGARAPRLRTRAGSGRALLITSSAAPATVTRMLSQPVKTLRRMARLLGKRPCGTIVRGRQSLHESPTGKQLSMARARGAELVDLSARYATHGAEPREHTTA